jgi:hypothetical protein
VAQSGCRDPDHHYGDRTVAAYVRVDNGAALPVCRMCLSGWQDRKQRGGPIEIERI